MAAMKRRDMGSSFFRPSCVRFLVLLAVAGGCGSRSRPLDGSVKTGSNDPRFDPLIVQVLTETGKLVP
jgi:hypothetical protein